MKGIEKKSFLLHGREHAGFRNRTGMGPPGRHKEIFLRAFKRRLGKNLVYIFYRNGKDDLAVQRHELIPVRVRCLHTPNTILSSAPL